MDSTSILTSAEMTRLNRLDEDLRREADAFLRESGLGTIIAAAGFHPVGSYVMHTMTWRDLDFERTSDEPSWAEHWTLGQALAATGWGWRFSCIDAYRDPRTPGECGHYWGIRACPPGGGVTWKLDLWTARPHEFEDARRAAWMAALSEEARLHILAIKEAICYHPDYRDTLLSVHIYEAVLEEGIRGIEPFWAWWRNRRVKSEE